MLQAIRDKTSGWIAYLIIGLISIPFALWGINSYLGGGEETPAAVVDGNEITPRQLDSAYARYRDRLSSVFGGQIPDSFANESILKEQALTQLIEERVLSNYIRDKGFRVGDEKLFKDIRAMQVFQNEGRFDANLYQDQLASQGYTAAFFEQELRQSQQMAQLNLAIKATGFTVPVQLDKFKAINNQSRKIRTIRVNNKRAAISVTEQNLRDAYEKSAGRYVTAERVKLDYLEVNLETIRETINISEDDVQQRYEQSREQLTTPEIRTASHILLSIKEGDDSDSIKQKLVDIKSRISAGESFAALAREFSDDSISAAEGGDLGEVERGMMVKPFETALFGMNIGEISEPVNSKFGWHLIQLNEIAGGETQTLDQARNKIEQELQTEKAESQIYDLVESLANIGYEQPDSLLPASEQLGLKLQTTDWFDRSKGEGLAESDKIRQLAFSDDVLNQNRNSETIELDDSRVAIVHLNSHEKAQKRPFEEVKGLVESAIKNKKGRELAQSEGSGQLAKLNNGEAFEQVILNLEQPAIIDHGFIKRTDTTIDSEILSSAFTMQKPQSGKVVYSGVSSLKGDYIIIELSDIKFENSSEATESDENNDPVKGLTDASTIYEYQAMIKVLTDQADIIRTPVSELQ